MAKSRLEDDYLTPEKVAETLKVHVRTIQREITRGKIEAVKVGRQYRIPKRAFDEYLERNSVNLGEKKSLAKDLNK